MTADLRSPRPETDFFRGLMLAALPSIALWGVVALAMKAVL